jgi:low temperature requirement protein LtrA
VKNLIRVPQLWPASGSGRNRRVTWMELFFDLIFAAAVAQVGSPLSMHYTAPDLGRYVFLLVLIWLAWSGHTLYSTRFDTDDLVQRLLVLVQAFIAAVMAANAKEALDSTSSAGFGAAYAVMRLILAGQYLRARRIRETREMTTRFAIGYASAAVFWIASAISPLPERYVLWALALTIDLATPWFSRTHSLRHPPDAAHYPERFGLFTIILLGEFVAAVMRGIESQEYWSVPAASTAFTSMAFGFVIWWWYFDGAQSSAERHVRTKTQARLFHVWTYAHLPVFVGIGIAGVGFHHAISVHPGSSLPAGEGAVLSAAVALLMAGLILIGATAESRQPRIALQAAMLTVVAGLGIVSDRISALVMVVGITGCAAVQTILAHASHPGRQLHYRESFAQNPADRSGQESRPL